MKYVVQALWKNEHAMFRARARPNIVLHKNLVLSMTWTRYLSIWCSSVVAAVIHSGLIKAFPELSWDFTSKIKVGLSLRQILSPCHCLESYPPRWLQLSNCCAHHGTLEVGAKTLQTVKVHIKVCSLQGRPATFFPSDWYGTRVIQCAGTFLCSEWIGWWVSGPAATKCLLIC